MQNKARSPFDGKPTTTETKDDEGRSSTYTVALKALTPWRARIADWLSLFASIAAGACAIRLIFWLDDPNAYEVLALLAMPIPTYWAVRFTLYTIMQKTKHVVFTPEHFIIKGLIKDRTFDRNLGHSFALYHHDRAGREEEMASFRDRNRRGWWWLWPKKRYLKSSYHLSFEYLDQRNDIMTVYRRKHAYRLLSRLNAIKRILATEARGVDQVMTPERDWSAQPGDLTVSFE